MLFLSAPMGLGGHCMASYSRTVWKTDISSLELCFILLSGLLYSCFAYATVYAMLTRPQWEPTRLIPLKACLRRANARVKWCHNTLFCLRRHTFGFFWKSGNATFAYATTVPSTFLFTDWHALRHPAAPKQPSSKAFKTSCSHTLQRHQHPYPEAHTKHLAIYHWRFSYSWPCPRQVERRVRRWLAWCFNVRKLFWRGENVDFEYWLVRMWAGGQSGHPSLRGVYAKSTRSLRLFQVSPGRNLVKHSSVPGIPVTNKQSINEPGAFEPFGPQLSNTMRL